MLSFNFETIKALNPLKKFKNLKASLIAIPIAILLIAYSLYANWYNERPEPDQDTPEQDQNKKIREKYVNVNPCAFYDPLVNEGHEGYEETVLPFYKKGFVFDHKTQHDNGTFTICFKYDGKLVTDESYVVDPIEEKPVDEDKDEDKTKKKSKFNNFLIKLGV
jgi:hypothetical protein